MRLNIQIKALAILLPLFAQAAKEDFFVYQPRQRPPEELQKAAEGLSAGARVRTFGNKLIIYGTKSQRDAILHLFGELDHKLSNYVVSFRIASTATSKQESFGLETQGIVRKKSGSASPAVEIGVTGGEGAVSAKVESSDRDVSGDASHRLVVSEGARARLYSSSGIFSRTVSVYLRPVGKSMARLDIRELDGNLSGEQELITEIDVPLNQ